MTATTSKQTAMEILESAQVRLENKKNAIYFLAYDTKDNSRAAIKHIYDMALVLKEHEYNAKILVEEKTYTGIKNWLGDTYDEIPIVTYGQATSTAPSKTSADRSKRV